MKQIQALAISVIALLGSDWTAKAQTASSAANASVSDRGVFIEGAFLADRDPTLPLFTPSTTPGVALGVGKLLTNRSSLRFELEIPSWHRDEVGGAIYDYYDSNLGKIVVGPSTRRDAERTNTYSVLYGFHPPPRGRFRAGVLVGGAWTTKLVNIQNLVPGTEQVITYASGLQTEQYLAVVGGFDAEVALTPHIGVVPQLRVEWEAWPGRGDAGGIVRPRVGLRWRF